MIRMVMMGTAALLLFCTAGRVQACPGAASYASVVTAPETGTATDLSAAKKKGKPAARRAAPRPASGAGGAGGGGAGGAPAGGSPTGY